MSFIDARQRVMRAILGTCALRIPSAAALIPTAVPIPVVQYRHPGTRARELMILLPGIGDDAACYERQGFAAEAMRRTDADVWVVDAHVGYYARRTVIDRLHADVLRPARQSGYRSITLGGISLGGFGALLYASHHPNDVDRLITLAPFLGRPAVVKEIAASGLAEWRPGAVSAQDYERRLWQWLKGYADDMQSLPPLFLGFGTGDPFAPGHQLLAPVLPHGQVFMTDGGHTWPTWRTLWCRLLDLTGSPPST